MARSRIKPKVQKVGLFPEAAASTFRAGISAAHQLRGCLRIPDISRVTAELPDHVFEYALIRERLLAGIAVEDRDRYAPHALARNAPVGTPRHHVPDAVFAPARVPFHLFDGGQSVRL